MEYTVYKLFYKRISSNSSRARQHELEALSRDRRRNVVPDPIGFLGACQCFTGLVEGLDA